MKKSSSSMVSLGITVVLILIVIGLSQSLIHIIGRQSLLKERKDALINTQKETETLKHRLQEVNDPAFVEREAREKLNMAKEGETIIFIDNVGQSATEQQTRTPATAYWKLWLDLFF